MYKEVMVDHLERLTPTEWKVLLCSPIKAKQRSEEIFWTRGYMICILQDVLYSWFTI